MLSLRLSLLKNDFRQRPWLRLATALLFFVLAVLIYRGTLWFLGFLEDYPFAARPLVSKSLETMFLLLAAAVLLSALPGSLGVLYGSRDLHLLLAWPIPAWRVFAAKLLETYAATAGLPALLTFPVLLALGVYYQAPSVYYPLAFLAAVSVYALPVALGASLALFFLRFSPPGRAREWAAAGSALLGGLLVYGIRALRPEAVFKRAFANPEALEAFLREWARGGPPFLPTTWAARGVEAALSGQLAPPVVGLLVLSLVWFGLVVLAAAWAYRTGWVRGVEGSFTERPPAPPAPWEGWSPASALWLRDLRRFFRDPHRVSELLLVFVLVMLYLTSLMAMPFEGVLFRRVVGFLHLAFQGFVLVAVGLRLAFPLFGLEGEEFWLVRTAPVSPGLLVFTRFVFALFLLLPLALLLGAWVPAQVGLAAELGAVSLVSALAVALVAAALGVGFGVLWPAEGEGALGIGGVIYMLVGLVFAAGVAVLDTYPAYLVILGRGFWGGEGAWAWSSVLLALTLLFVLTPLMAARWKLARGL